MTTLSSYSSITIKYNSTNSKYHFQCFLWLCLKFFKNKNPPRMNTVNSYFIVFDTRGFVYHEEGKAPNYLNELIIRLDLTKLKETKKVRDKTCEYLVRGNKVYLTLSNTGGILDSEVQKYDELNKRETPVEENTKMDKMKGMSKSFVHKSFTLFTGKIKLSELEEKMSSHLVKMNVDPKYSKLLTDDAVSQFKEEETEWITEKEFKSRAKRALSRILPSIDHVNLIETIKKGREEGIPYTFCFVGVNGVGKSTSLAKMTRWLLEHDISVFIAACDTFRAGAVEQLKVHVDRFVSAGKHVGFYESGYNKDDATVAKSAIAKAKEGKYDVVLIDTAGRTHGNKVLMTSLSKIIRVNNPRHIIYVGEALTGNDSVDFIGEFNRYITNGKEDRKIDSIILTKIDTVGEKIGQVFNLTFTVAAPVLFLGCGQTNNDFMEVNPDEIASLLLN